MAVDLHTDAVALWQHCLREFRTMIPEKEFNTWIQPIKPKSIEGKRFSIIVPSDFFREQIEKTYLGYFSQVLVPILGENTELYYLVQVDSSAPVDADHAMGAVSPSLHSTRSDNGLPHVGDPTKTHRKFDSQLNGYLTFHNFYVSESNRIAHTMAKTIAEHPGQPGSNPFFLYGPSGVGKTHLCHAIGHRVKELFPDLRVLYVPSDTFVAQYTTAELKHQRNDFVGFYQQVDLLIIDDVQRLLGMDKTQKIFFQIFNHLNMLNKQIVMTSDTAPIHLQNLEERMATRINGSLTVAIDRPDINLRREILTHLMADNGVRLGEEVVDYMANNLTQDVRTIKGAFNSLLANSVNTPSPIDLHFTKRIVSRSAKLKKDLTVSDIQKAVCSVMHTKMEDILGNSRLANIMLARKIAMYLCKEMTTFSLKSIADQFGPKRTHSTVIYAHTNIQDQMPHNSKLREAVEKIRKYLG